MGFGKHELSTINFVLPPSSPKKKKIYITPLPPHNNDLYSKRHQLPLTATSPQRPHSFVPKVAILERLNCSFPQPSS